MLANHNSIASIAVHDLARARAFYGGTLGLKVVGTEHDGVLDLRSGSSQLVVYVSAFAGTNQATSAAWAVGEDFDALVHDLQAKGVAFAHYELPGLQRHGDVHTDGRFKAAWFKDPDGNILHILNQ